jgi:hypothetical protein
MSPFDYVMALLSLVYALALAHVLSRAGAFILARDRVRFSGLQALAMVNAVLQVFLSWLSSWNLHALAEWDLATIAIGFAYAITVYFLCAAAAPDLGEGPLDLETFYWRNHRIFYGVVALYGVVSLLAALPLLRSLQSGVVMESELTTLLVFVPCALAIFIPSRWAQWASGVGLLAITIGWLFGFSSTLR